MTRPALLRSPAAVLAWSETLLDGWPVPASERSPGLALWVSRIPAVAIGLAQSAASVARLDEMERDGVALLRRQSGGGAVLLAPGVLCWEAWATEDALRALSGGGGAGIRPAYAALSGPVRAGLESLGASTVLTGVCDLAVRVPGRRAGEGGVERKIAGMAQLRRRGRVLVHGCVLVSLDIRELGKYLPPPPDADAPAYRRGRSHRDFCVTVGEVLGEPPGEAPAEELTEDLPARLAGAVEQSATQHGWAVFSPPEEEALPRPARRLLDEKYARREWNLRRARGKNNVNSVSELTVN